MTKIELDGSPRRLLDGALVANNPTQFALAEAAALRRAARADLGEANELDLVVSLGTGSAPARAASSSGEEARSFLGSLPRTVKAARDFVFNILDLLTDTDATHDLVKRQLRDVWRPDELTRRYHRLEAVVDARHLKLDEGDADCLRDLRAMALDYLKRDRGLEWRHLVGGPASPRVGRVCAAATRRRRGGGDAAAATWRRRRRGSIASPGADADRSQVRQRERSRRGRNKRHGRQHHGVPIGQGLRQPARGRSRHRSLPAGLDVPRDHDAAVRRGLPGSA